MEQIEFRTGGYKNNALEFSEPGGRIGRAPLGCVLNTSALPSIRISLPTHRQGCSSNHSLLLSQSWEGKGGCAQTPAAAIYRKADSPIHLQSMNKPQKASKKQGVNLPAGAPACVVGFRRPRPQWNIRCRYCEGTGKVASAKGGWSDCTGCAAL